MLFIGDWGASCSPTLDPKPVTRRPVEQLELAKHTVPAPQGEVPVIFTPHAIAYLLMPLTSAVNGRTVLQGASPLQGKLGAQLLDPRFSLWDDPTVPLRPDSRSADDEGVPSRKTKLIERGVPQGFLYDLQTAGLAGAQTTGSASRGLSSLPAPSTSVIFIEKGDTPYARMIADIKDGLIIEQLLGAGQGNVVGGEIGGNVLLGYRIQNGQVTGRVKDTVVAGNVYTALSAGKLIALSDTQEWVSGSLLTPAIACMGLTVSAKRASE
jgi:PmbA protein